jgi:hypothetical protein
VGIIVIGSSTQDCRPRISADDPCLRVGIAGGITYKIHPITYNDSFAPEFPSLDGKYFSSLLIGV